MEKILNQQKDEVKDTKERKGNKIKTKERE